MKKILKSIVWGIIAFMVFYVILGICAGIYVLINAI
jgi:hypothetical protein